MAAAMFERLRLFGPRLETSLQRGQILFGAFKSNPKIKHRNFVQLLRFAFSELWWASTNASGCCSVPHDVQGARKAASWSIKPIEVETKEIVAQMKIFCDSLPSQTMRRELQEVETLYTATRESSLSCLLIWSGFLSLITGTAFTLGNILVAISNFNSSANFFLMAGLYSFGIITPIGSVLACYFFSRQVYFIFSCYSALGRKLLLMDNDSAQFKRNLVHIRHVALAQAGVICLRLTSIGGAGIALPWFLIAQTHGLNNQIPMVVAFFSFALQMIALFMQLVVEYTILYNLDPVLGKYVCVAFETEIHHLKREFSVPQGPVETKQAHERVTWEYVARAIFSRYRFDAVFSANRFGAMFQYVQTGSQHVSIDDDLDEETLRKSSEYRGTDFVNNYLVETAMPSAYAGP